MNKRYAATLILVVAISLTSSVTAWADANVIVSTRSRGPLTVTLTSLSGETISASDDDRDGVVNLTTRFPGQYRLTLTAAGETETTTVTVPPSGTLAIAFDPAASPRISVSAIGVAEQITVTAPKREQLLQDVPMSITAIPQKELENLGAAEFTDYARTVPGLTFVDRGPTQTQVILRGVSPLVGASTVGLYVDGLSLASSFNNPDLHLFDVNQIEVVRGPQGTLYGEGAMGGTINIMTNRPDPSAFDTKIDLGSSTTRGGGHNYAVNAMVNVPLVADKLALRVVGHTSDRSGWIDNTFLDRADVNDEQSTGIRTAARWLISSRSALTLSADVQRVSVGGQNQVNAVLGGLRNDTQVREPQNDDINLYAMEFNHDLGWSDLTFVGGWMDRDSDSQNDFGFGPDYPAFFVSEQKVLSGELRLASKAKGGPWSWVAGTFAKKWDRDNVIWSDGAPLAPGIVTRYVGSVDFGSEMASVFGDVTYDFNERWSATGGLRYFTQDQHDVTLTEVPLFGIVLDQTDLEERFTDVSPKFGASFRARDNALLYGTVAKGYRAGGTNPLHASNPQAPLGYESDVVWSYEAGAKTATRDGRITASAAIYHMEWDNLQILGTPDNALLGYTTNAGKAKSDGIEFEVGARPMAGLGLDFGAAFADAVLVEPAQGGEAGNRLPFVPKVMFNASAHYERPMTAALTGIARLDYSWRGDSYRDVTNAESEAMDSYGLANLRLGVSRGAWEVSAFARNITDERADLDRNAGIYFFRNEPRTLGLNIRFHPTSSR